MSLHFQSHPVLKAATLISFCLHYKQARKLSVKSLLFLDFGIIVTHYLIVGASEQPKTGESAKDVSTAAAGKDATVLIVLFVVVLVIGAAAFTHHFIKKRKANNDHNSINGITKDLESPKNGDVEQGVEMKPLLNSNKPIIVKEFSDKKSDEA